MYAITTLTHAFMNSYVLRVYVYLIEYEDEFKDSGSSFSEKINVHRIIRKKSLAISVMLNII